MTLTPQAVYLDNESWLRTVVRSRVHESEAVEDIMQNIALALVRQRDVLRDIGQLGAWLYQIAVRQVMMYRRTVGRRRNFENRLAQNSRSVDAVFSQVDPVASVLAAERQETVRSAVQQLDELDRQVLMLKYVEGWTYRQLAEMLGVSEDTIEYRLLKSRKRLKALLQHQGGVS
ncbi:MAG: sigma-70 family RNA polymerase sigma factor [Fuerstiella sp.]|nr:sigma-70 family RNA polymerase sigma factor [Fuerstiella sp.]